MADNQRIDDLRRRVQKDPASIAFAQLAEELRRAGEHQESVDVCRAGLQIHPAYLSARVTLGRALLELNELPDAQAELEYVLKSAPENLAAIRGLGEIHHRRGELPEALAQYRAALALARNDPDLQETVDQLSRQIEPQKPAVPDDGLSFDQIQNELLKLAPVLAAPSETATSPLPWEVVLQAPAAQSEPPVDQPDANTSTGQEQIAAASSPLPWEVVLQAPAAQSEPPVDQPDANTSGGQEQIAGAEQAQSFRLDDVDAVLAPPLLSPDAQLEDAGAVEFVPLQSQGEHLEDAGAAAFAAPQPSPDVHPEDAGTVEDVAAELAPSTPELAVGLMVSEDPMRDHAERTVAALEQWLAAINVARPERSA